MKKVFAPILAAMVAIAGLVLVLQSGQDPARAAENAAAPAAAQAGEAASPGAAAIQRAAAAGKHLFVFFYEGDGEETKTARKAFEAAVAKLSAAADWVAVDRTVPAEKALVEKFGIQRAPVPLIVALAPNGVVTGGSLASEVTEEKLKGSIASAAMQKCLKALQERKFVLLCVQNGETKYNEPALRGAQDFKADAKYGPITEIVTLDPADPAEASFLAKLGVDPKTDEATTVFLAPPGVTVARIKGATDSRTLLATLQKAAASCGSSCGPATGG